MRRRVEFGTGAGVELVATAAAGLGAPTVVWIVVGLLGLAIIGFSLTGRSGERSNPDLEAELTAIIDQGKRLDRGPFFDLHYGSYKFWCDKAAAFLLAVFGPEERDAFDEAGGLSERLAWLRDRRQCPPKVRGDIEAAATARGEVSDGDRIVLAGGPLRDEYAD